MLVENVSYEKPMAEREYDAKRRLAIPLCSVYDWQQMRESGLSEIEIAMRCWMQGFPSEYQYILVPDTLECISVEDVKAYFCKRMQFCASLTLTERVQRFFMDAFPCGGDDGVPSAEDLIAIAFSLMSPYAGETYRNLMAKRDREREEYGE